jgi:hypothetical protein
MFGIAIFTSYQTFNVKQRTSNGKDGNGPKGNLASAKTTHRYFTVICRKIVQQAIGEEPKKKLQSAVGYARAAR